MSSDQRRERASADDEFWKNEVRVRQEEIGRLRKLADAVERAHVEYGHEDEDGAGRCDEVCLAWKAWAAPSSRLGEKP